MALDNYQPSLAVNQLVQTSGPFPGMAGVEGDFTMAMVRMFAGNFAWEGSAAAAGQLLDVSANTPLFSLLGTIYGGDGATNFALPDLQASSSLGAGEGNGLPLYFLGEEAGTAEIDLIQAQVPARWGGSHQPLDNLQPAVAINYLIRVSGHGTGTGDVLGGVVKYLADVEFRTPPSGYLAANGQLVLIADYPDLFNLIGTTYGGDGQDNFALPDLESRIPIGAGGAFQLGEPVGADPTVTPAQMPISMGGGGQPVSNYAPSLGLSYIICIDPTTFPQSQGGQTVDPADAYLGEIMLYAGGLVPPGWALCDGSALPITPGNIPLFSIIGTTYGGDGQNNFRLPDFRGRTDIGSLDGEAVGGVYGSGTMLLTLADIPHLTITGTSGNDTLLAGGDGNDTIDGLEGNDSIVGHGGDDSLIGGDGSDTLEGGDGDDNLDGGADTDILHGGAGNDTLDAGGGFDGLNYVATNGHGVIFNLSAGAIDTDLGQYSSEIDASGVAALLAIYGQSSFAIGASQVWDDHGDIDTISNFEVFGGTALDDFFVGSDGNEVVALLAGNDWAYGLGGNDLIDGHGGDDHIFGGAGADTISGMDGADFLSGGQGDDIFAYNSTAETGDGAGYFDTVDGGDGTDSLFIFGTVVDLAGVTLASIEQIKISASTTKLILDDLPAGISVLTEPSSPLSAGFELDASAVAGAGIWFKSAGFNGDDTIVTGDGSDTLESGAGADELSGGDGNDRFVVASATAFADDTIDGGDGYDTLVLAAGTYDFGSRVSSIQFIELSGDSFTQIDLGATAIPTAGLSFGSAARTASTVVDASTMVTSGGSQLMVMGNNWNGDDTIIGSSGNDWLTAGVGSNSIEGGDGVDKLDYNWANFDLVVDTVGGTVKDAATNGANLSDTVENVENFWLAGGDDEFTGSSADEIVSGYGGNDTIDAGGGFDEITAGTGADVVIIDSADDLGDYVDMTAEAGTTDTLRITTAGTYDFTGANYFNIDVIELAGDQAAWLLTLDDDLVSTAQYGGTLGHLLIQASVALANRVTINGSAVAAGHSLIVDGTNFDSADLLIGGAGDDTIDGGAGNDTITGGAGTDNLVGGTGEDTFILTSAADLADTIDGGSTEQDTLALYGAGTYDFTGNNLAIADIDVIELQAPGAFTIVLSDSVLATASYGSSGHLTVSAQVNTTAAITLDASAVSAPYGILFIGEARADGDDSIIGGAGDDSLDAGAGNNTVLGGDGNDTIEAGAGADSLSGGNGDDAFIIRSIGDLDGDTIGGGSGTDSLQLYDSGAYTFASTITDIETIALADTGTWSLVLTDQMVTGTLSISSVVSLTDAVTIDGSALVWHSITGADKLIVNGANFGGNDSIIGGDGHDSLSGGAGDDTIIGNDGDDTIIGGAGIDSLIGGGGNDTFVVTDLLDIIDAGSQSRDTLRLDLAGAHDFTGAAIAGIDAIVLSDDAPGWDITLTEALIAGGNFLGAGVLQISADTLLTHGVTIDGSGVLGTHRILLDGTNLGGADSVLGGAGQDSLEMGAGNDTAYGGDGDDQFVGGAGVDSLIGGAGSDTFILNNTADIGDTIDGTDGVAENDELFITAAGTYNFSNTNITNIDAISLIGNGADWDITLTDALMVTANAMGVSGWLYISANAPLTHSVKINASSVSAPYKFSIDGDLGGDDTIATGAGDDTIRSGAGADSVDGGAGNDTIDGGSGTDTLIGGLGADIFILSSAADLGDTIDGTEESGSEDVLRLDAAGTYDFTATNISYIDIIRLTGATGDYTLILSDDLVATAAESGTVGSIGIEATGVTGKVTIDGSALTGSHAIVISPNAINADTDVTGSAWFDTLRLGAGNDTVRGGGSIDYISGGAGADDLDGGSGDDSIYILNASELTDGTDYDTIVGGTGVDHLYLNAPDTYDLRHVSISGIELIQLSSVGTTLLLGDIADAEHGSVTISGYSNTSVTIDASAATSTNFNFNGVSFESDDTIIGGGGDDTFVSGAGADSLAGGDGDDVFRTPHAAALSNDIIDGGDGEDRLVLGGDSFSLTTGSVSNIDIIELLDGVADPTTIMLGNTVVATAAYRGQAGLIGITSTLGVVGPVAVDATALTGSHAVRVDGGRFNMSDSLAGGDGDDWFAAGEGQNTIAGGDGIDTLDYTFTAFAMDIDAANGSAVDVTNGGTRISDGFSGIERFILGEGYDSFVGGSASETITGGDGNDTIDGGGGTADRVVYTLDWRDYQFSESGGVITVTALSSLEGTDLVSNVEFFEFAGGVVATKDQVLNDEPLALDDAATLIEPTGIPGVVAVGGNVMANDSDADVLLGDSFAVVGAKLSIIGQQTGFSGTLTLHGFYGTLVIASDGSYSYTVDPNAMVPVVGGSTMYDEFDYLLEDSWGERDVGHLAFTIIEANDAPTGSDKTIGIVEDGAPYSFTASDFGFVDSDGNDLQSVIITSLPAAGTLRLNGVAVTLNQTIAAGAIGALVFAPALNGNGSPYGSFAFKVVDNGGAANGGQNTDAVANTIRFNVAGVNDAPVITSNGGAALAVSVNENAVAVTSIVGSDVDSSVAWSLTGTDAALFDISSTGIVTFRTAPDFEAPADAGGNNRYDVIIVASDGTLTDTQDLTIDVGNLAGNTVNGNSSANTVNLIKGVGGVFATNEEDRIDGKGGNDKLNGFGGNDTLIGGAGKDTLDGGAGADSFVFNAKLGTSNVDTIKSFTHDTDIILLENSIFTKIGASLDAGEFYAKKGAVKAHDRDDRIIYDTKTGKLYFDADGNKTAHKAIHFATITDKPVLDHGDFLIV